MNCLTPLQVMRVIVTASQQAQSASPRHAKSSSKVDGAMAESPVTGMASARKRKRNNDLENVEDEGDTTNKRKATSDEAELDGYDDAQAGDQQSHGDDDDAVVEAAQAAAAAVVAEEDAAAEIVEEAVHETKSSSKKRDADGGWLNFYNRLVEYKKRNNGSTEVPQRYKEDPALGSWCKNQREYYKSYNSNRTSSLTEERIALLNKIDFAWVSSKTKRRVMKDFDVHLAELQQYKQIHRHTRVPHVYQENPGLGVFCHRVKIYHREMQEGKRKSPNDWLTPERIEALNDIEFEWKVGRWKNALSWEERYAQLVEFHAKHGHTRVNKDYDECVAPGLKTWVANQRTYLMTAGGKKKRRMKKAIVLTEERIAKLKLLGVEFEKEESAAFESPEETFVEGVSV